MSAFSEHSPPLMSSGGAHSKVPWKLVIIVLSFTSILDRPTSCNEQTTVMRKTRLGLVIGIAAEDRCQPPTMPDCQPAQSVKAIVQARVLREMTGTQ